MKVLNKDFNLLISGQVISVFGAAILKFALSLDVLDRTGRADIFATLLALSIVPGIILVPFGGAVADRLNRRNMMVGFDLASFILVLVFIGSVYSNRSSLFLIGITITLLTLISGLYQPTVRASIPSLVTENGLARANGLIGGVAALSNLAGPIAGGILYNMVGLNLLLILGAAAFLMSAILELFIKMPHVRVQLAGSLVTVVKQDMIDGFKFILHEKPYIARTMILAASLNLFLTPFFIIGMPYVLRITLASSDIQYGAAMGAIQLSGIVGALSVDRLSRRLKFSSLPRWIATMAFLTVPMALSMSPHIRGLGYWPAYLGFILFAVPVMMILAMLSVYAVTIIQKETPNHLLGKVMAIIGTAAQAAAPVGQLLYGQLFQAFNIQVYVPTLLAGAFTLTLSILAYWLLSRGQPQLLTVKRQLSA